MLIRPSGIGPKADLSQIITGSQIFMKTRSMHPLMNDTKWDQLRLAMYGLDAFRPRWRKLDIENGYLSQWDGEWFYHFPSDGYKSIHWVDIAVDTAEQRAAVLAELVRIHLPGERTESGYRVFGYAKAGTAVGYIEG